LQNLESPGFGAWQAGQSMVFSSRNQGMGDVWVGAPSIRLRGRASGMSASRRRGDAVSDRSGKRKRRIWRSEAVMEFESDVG